jgi:hypothetical protein
MAVDNLQIWELLQDIFTLCSYSFKSTNLTYPFPYRGIQCCNDSDSSYNKRNCSNTQPPLNSLTVLNNASKAVILMLLPQRALISFSTCGTNSFDLTTVKSVSHLLDFWSNLLPLLRLIMTALSIVGMPVCFVMAVTTKFLHSSVCFPVSRSTID